MSSPSFTFVNDTGHEIYGHTYHIGCGGLPWIDGLPRCNTQSVVAHANGTYVPSAWVDDFVLIGTILLDTVLTIGAVAITVVTAGAAAPVDAAVGAEIAGNVAAAAAEAGATVAAESLGAVIAEAGTASALQGIASSLGVSVSTIQAAIVATGAAQVLVATGAVIESQFNGYAWYLTQADGRLYKAEAVFIDLVSGKAMLLVDDSLSAWTEVTGDDLPRAGKLGRLPGFASPATA